ncbi:MAG: ABC transporter permease [Candidatus Aminicenantes bacterium]|nr:MAG: ABC transporter permease [Candidatus Aminicenantes bacterium]
MIMLKSYLKVLVRNLWKNKFSSFLNILGLAIGMTGYLLILQYVNFELSYDDFHKSKDNIYRLRRDSYEDNGMVNRWAVTSYNAGPTLKEEFPEVAEVSRCLRFENNSVRIKDRIFKDEKIYITEPSFFKIFSIRFLEGDPQAALQGPNKLVLSESTARKYFANENPLGQMIEISSKRTKLSFMITGVFKDLPQNTHMKFDLLMSINTIYPAAYSDWIYASFYTYILLTPGADAKGLEAKLPAFIKKYILKDIPRAANWKYLLQPLREIYLYSDLTFDTDNGNGKMVYFLLIIAFLILVISWVNYVNLSAARAMDRAREVGIRKVLGSHRFRLSKQFLGESILTNIIPIAISVVLTIIFHPFLEELTGKNIPLYLSNALFLLHLVILYLIGSLIAGLYPAVLLSSFPPVTVLNKSKFSQTIGGGLLKKILVTFQFTASAVLIILTFTVYKQIRYMTNNDLGINLNNMMAVVLPTIPLNQDNIKNIDSFKTELLRYPAIEKVSGSLIIPGTSSPTRLAWKENTDFKKGKMLSIALVDDDFLPAYQIKFLSGRNFSRKYGTDNQSVILNEAAIESLGYDRAESTLNQNISLWDMKGNFKIIGIIKNYHQKSLKKSHEPIVFLYNPSFKNFYSIKLKPGITNIDETINLIQKKWKEIFPAHPFDYFFLDDFFNRQYKDDYQFGTVLGIFVVLAVIITCLGLLGLSYFSAYQRRKEIAIRKSIGASTGDILGLLAKDIVKLVVIATVIAWPIVYFFIIDPWLKNYAYRIAVPLLFFILSGLVLVIITLLTIAYHTITAARANPVDALREE